VVVNKQSYQVRDDAWGNVVIVQKTRTNHMATIVLEWAAMPISLSEGGVKASATIH
jgi:hypothetical protein